MAKTFVVYNTIGLEVEDVANEWEAQEKLEQSFDESANVQLGSSSFRVHSVRFVQAEEVTP